MFWVGQAFLPARTDKHVCATVALTNFGNKNFDSETPLLGREFAVIGIESAA